LAAEQGREVFAVPGPVDAAASAGSLQLLRKGATLVRSADDILEDLQEIPPLVEGKSTAPIAPPANLGPLEQKIWEALTERHNVEELTESLAVPIAELTRNLMALELKKIVRRLPGNCYERF
jgi:DNA processing protein